MGNLLKARNEVTRLISEAAVTFFNLLQSLLPLLVNFKVMLSYSSQTVL